jgi:hypothetical protein
MASTTYNITPGRYDRDIPSIVNSKFLNSAASTNATLLKGSSGTIYNIIVHNTVNGAGNERHLRLYNLSTAPNVGVDAPVCVISIPPNASKEINLVNGITFDVGIGFSLTAGEPLLDATPVAAGDIQLYIGYI